MSMTTTTAMMRVITSMIMITTIMTTITTTITRGTAIVDMEGMITSMVRSKPSFTVTEKD